VHVDFWTNNRELLHDPLYLRLRQPRISTAERDEFVEEFVRATQEVFPGCCLHFEDWAGVDAMRLLARYRDRVCCYNDDIQGTAGVALAGILSALRVTGGRAARPAHLVPRGRLGGIGIADLIASAMTLEGLTLDQARARISLSDVDGLLEPSRADHDFEKPYAHPHAPSRDFVGVIESLKPTAIIGVSTKGKAFNRQVTEAMARVNKRPIIFALSDPTDHAVCTAEEAYRWSEGRALYAAGVSFPPVRYAGKTLVPGQGNNLYIFSAVGLRRSRTMSALLTSAGADRLLPAVLSTTAGAVDVIIFLALAGLFAAHITGNLVVVAAYYITGGFGEAGPLLAVPVFIVVLGAETLASVAVVKAGYSPRRGLLVLQTAFLAGCLVLGIWFGPFADANRPIAVVVGMLAVAAMATQHALGRLALPGAPSTAVMTTNTTQLTVDLAMLALPPGKRDDLAGARHRVRVTVPCILGFLADYVAGAVLAIALGELTSGTRPCGHGT
jgi:uncharacterized membrane protein YoaK (UPF0700 family)